jgi:membrane protein implicated in regulation of membrane protease activity
MNAEWLINWWNLIFLLPLGLALLYLGLYMASGITFGESEIDADADADLDGNVDAGIDHDMDHDVSADADHDLDTDHDAGAGHNAEVSEHASTHAASGSALAWIGFGKVPVSLTLMVLLLTWGTAGLIINAGLIAKGASAAAVSIPVAGFISLFVTRLVVMLIGRYLPLNETTARRRHALLGCVGETVFQIDQRFGMAAVRDDTGDLYQVGCRIEAGCQPIAKGTKVKLVGYNAKSGLFVVMPATDQQMVA